MTHQERKKTEVKTPAFYIVYSDGYSESSGE
jgi:hypothetical protein